MAARKVLEMTGLKPITMSEILGSLIGQMGHKPHTKMLVRVIAPSLMLL